MGMGSNMGSMLHAVGPGKLRRFLVRIHQLWRNLALQFPKLRIEHLTLIRSPRRGLVFAVAREELPQIRQRHVAPVLVDQLDNPLCWELLQAAGRKTGLPVLYNTSFNLFGERLVCDPRAAVRSFYSSGIDTMLVGNFLLEK